VLARCSVSGCGVAILRVSYCCAGAARLHSWLPRVVARAASIARLTRWRVVGVGVTSPFVFYVGLVLAPAILLVSWRVALRLA